MPTKVTTPTQTTRADSWLATSGFQVKKRSSRRYLLVKRYAPSLVRQPLVGKEQRHTSGVPSQNDGRKSPSLMCLVHTSMRRDIRTPTRCTWNCLMKTQTKPKTWWVSSWYICMAPEPRQTAGIVNSQGRWKSWDLQNETPARVSLDTTSGTLCAVYVATTSPHQDQRNHWTG